MGFPQAIRLFWIQAHLHYEGRFNLADLQRAFGISRAQVSIDLREYRKRWPDAMRYCLTEKAYFVGALQPGCQALPLGPARDSGALSTVHEATDFVGDFVDRFQPEGAGR